MKPDCVTTLLIFLILAIAEALQPAKELTNRYSEDESQDLWALSFAKGVKVQNAKWGGFNPCVVVDEGNPQSGNGKEQNDRPKDEQDKDANKVIGDHSESDSGSETFEEVESPNFDYSDFEFNNDDALQWEKDDDEYFNNDEYYNNEDKDSSPIDYESEFIFEYEQPDEKDDSSKSIERIIQVDFSNLPKDQNSPEYIQSLQEIGIQSIASLAHGITYSFYTNNGLCKSRLEIIDDIELLSPFHIIRIYDTDCDGLSTILSHLKPYQKLDVGIYYLNKIEESVRLIHLAIIENGGQAIWDLIDTISVGNEIYNFQKATISELHEAVDLTRDLLRKIGFEGPVVTTDTLYAILSNPELCEVGDYISFNSHPYWDGNVKPENSGNWLKGQIELLKDVCGRDKRYVLAETGWPTKGETFGEYGVPSLENQLLSVKSIVDCDIGAEVTLFTTFNDYWKDSGEYGVEQYWGIME